MTFSLIRRALLRSAIFGVALAAVILAIMLAFAASGDGPAPSEALGVAGATLFLGLAAAPHVLIESLAATKEASFARDALVFLAVTLVAPLAVFAIILQITYAVGVHEHGSLAEGFEAVRALLAVSGQFSEGPLPTVWLLATPFPPATVARLRGLSLGKQVLVTLATASLLATPSFVAFFEHLSDGALVESVTVAGILVVFAAVPLVLRLADVIEERIRRRFERDS